MNARQALYALLSISFMYAALAGITSSYDIQLPKSVELVAGLLMLAGTYIWYYLDAAERGYRRTTLLGGAVILFSLLAVPYYLFRSRSRGQRAKAIFRFFGICVLYIVVVLISAIVADMVRSY